MSNENGPADRVPVATETWEEAAEVTSGRLVPGEIHYDVKATSIYVLLDSVERHLDALRVGNVSPAAYERWRWIAELGVAGYTQLCERSNIADTITFVVKTIIEKQHDYGHDNINWGGRQGLVIRTHDKVARIRNLMSRGVEDTKNEPLADSWLDLTGYGLIGMMFEDGTFNLPLKADVPVVTPTVTGNAYGNPKTDPWYITNYGVLAGLSQMQQSYDELLAPEVDTKPDGYEWLDPNDGYVPMDDSDYADQQRALDALDAPPPSEYEHVMFSDSEHVDAGLIVQTFTETPTKAFVGGWNSILGGGPGDPHGMWLTRGQIVELRDALDGAWLALNR